MDNVRDLLERGADTDIVDIWGISPLGVAAYRGHLSVCQVLCDHGAGLDNVDRSGSSPLVMAAKEGHLDICRLLCDRGCDLNISGWRHDLECFRT